MPDAFIRSMKPFLAGYFLAMLLGIPMGLLLGSSRIFDAAFGIYVTAGRVRLVSQAPAESS